MENVAHEGENRNAYKALVSLSEGNRPLKMEG
jgi:hypothetical protein